MSAARPGDVLEINSECVKRGKRLAFATVAVARKSDGQVIALGRQTKYIDSGPDWDKPVQSPHDRTGPTGPHDKAAGPHDKTSRIIEQIKLL